MDWNIFNCIGWFFFKKYLNNLEILFSLFGYGRWKYFIYEKNIIIIYKFMMFKNIYFILCKIRIREIVYILV